MSVKMKVVVVIVFLFPFVNSMKVLQTKRPLQKDSHAEYIPSTPVSDWKEFTICFKFKSFQFDSLDETLGGSAILALSMTAVFGHISTKRIRKEQDIYLKSKYGSIWNKGRAYRSLYHNDFDIYDDIWQLNVWKSACWVQGNKNMQFYLDGHLKNTGRIENPFEKIVFMNFIPLKSAMLGGIADMNIWNRTLTLKEVEKFSHCNVKGNIFSWDIENMKVLGLDEVEIEEDLICKGNVKPKVRFPYQNTANSHKENLRFCKSIGGKVAKFETQSEMEEINERLPSYSQVLFSGYYYNDGLLVNINDGSTIPLNTFDYGTEVKINGNCVFYLAVEGYVGMAIDNCNFPFPPICEHDSVGSVFMLRGVCYNNEVDVYYQFVNSTYLLGHTSTEMVFDESSSEWQIRSNRNGKLLAKLVNMTIFPIGLHNWTFEDPNCSDAGVRTRALKLHLDVDQPGKFVCDDGFVISSELVCEDIKQCPNGEDELNCSLMRPPDHEPDSPSYEVQHVDDEWKKVKTPVHASVIVYDIYTIKELDNLFELFFTIKLEWKDIELEYEFLKNDFEQNFFDPSNISIWVPDLEIYQMQKVTAVDFKTKHYAFKNVSAIPVLSGDTDKVNVREVHSGQDFTLITVLKKRAEFLCSFDNIKNYPFGKQECTWGFYIKFPADKLTQLIPKYFNGTNNPVGQYKVKEWIYTNYKRNGEEGIRVSLILERNLLSILMVSFFPSIIMNIINHASVFITGDSKFDLIYTINITSLMVLASIYLSVSNSLPSTSEIKPVEIWLLFNLLYPFFTIILHVILQVSH